MATQQSLAKRTEGLGADAVQPPQRPFDFCAHTKHTHGSYFVCVLVMCHEISILEIS